MERSLELQREITAQRRAEGQPDFICKGTLEIYDAGGLSFSQLHAGGLRLLARVLGLGAAHYPENLGKGRFLPFLVRGLSSRNRLRVLFCISHRSAAATIAR
jgi:hypothetical protein